MGLPARARRRSGKTRICPCEIAAATLAAATLAAAVVTACGTHHNRMPSPTSSVCDTRHATAAGHSLAVWLRVNPATDEQHRFREYRLHLPDGYTPTARTPLVLYFHGAGGTAAQADRDSGWSSLADRDHFLVAYPQGLPFGGGGPPAWASAGPIDFGIDDLAFIHAVLADIEKRACVDRGAVFAVGMSSGGGMAGYLACALSDTVAAAAPVAANNYVLTKLGCQPSRPVSVLEVHGTADQTVPYSGTGARIAPAWPLPSIRAWITKWAQLDRCHRRPSIDTVARQTIFRYLRCMPGTEVTLYRINGGGHTYPRQLAGRPSDAVIYHFFTTHHR